MWPRVALLAGAWVGMLLASCGEPADDRSFLITNVRIVDGSGAPPFVGSVQIADGRIVAVNEADDSIDNRGGGDANAVVYHGGNLVLAPGFIDTHSHADDDLFDDPEAIAALSQGITTTIVGQDGRSRYPLAEFVAQLAVAPPAVNVASFVGHNTVREIVLGDAFRRAASIPEIAEMRELVQSELDAGAIGLSTGLEYEPGIYSDRGEVLALAQVASAAGGTLVSHLRSEDRYLENALAELIHIGRTTGMPVKISHFKLAMRSLWGQAPRFLSMLDEARRDGVNITADAYPYEFWQSTMMVLLPERDADDRQAISFALAELAPPEGIVFTRFDPQPEYVGKKLAEIAAQMEMSPVDAFSQLANAALERSQETGEPAESIMGTSMHSDDVASILAWPHTNIATDGALVDRHPRATGTFTRVLGRYVRKIDGLDLPAAIRKMTGLAADHLGLAERGYVREGYAADLVLFDPNRVLDRSTVDAPERLSEGIAAVWVNGQLTYANGSATGARPGVFIRR